MRIVQYLNLFDLTQGGVVRAVLDLCAVLQSRGHQITVLTQDDRDVPEAWRKAKAANGHRAAPELDLRILARSLRSPFPRLDAASLAIARRAFEQADAIHLHVPWDTVNLQLGRLARSMGKPYVLSIHGMLDDFTIAQKSFKKRLYLIMGGRRLLEQALAVHCTANGEMEQSQRWYPKGRSAVIPLLFDLSEFEPLPGPELARTRFAPAASDQPTALFVGRLHPIKRVELLIEAAAELRRMGIACQVLLAGPAEKGQEEYEQRLRALARERRLEREVHFLGFVSGRDKLSLYQAATVFVLPSHHENFGFVSVESLACRTPVVTTRAVNIWPELEASGGAAICDATPGAMAMAMAGILKDPVTRTNMGDRGRAWVFSDLHPDKVAAAYEALYRGGVTG